MLMLEADDFGLNSRADRKILKLLSGEKISAVSVLANLITSVSLKDLRGVSGTALHINLVEGKSMVNLRPFSPLPFFVLKLFFKKIDTASLKDEIEAQLAFLTKNGLSINSLNSHQHVHALSPIAEVVEKIAKENGLTVRNYSSVQTFTASANLKYFFLKIVAFLSYFIAYGKLGLPASWRRLGHPERSEGSVIMSWEGKNLDVSALQDKNLKLVIHPGLGYDTNLSYLKLL